MAGSKSDYLESAVLNHFLKNTATSSPANVFLGILSVINTGADTQTEIPQSNYTATDGDGAVTAGNRPKIVFGTVSGNNVTGPDSNIEFENDSGSSFTVVGFGIYDAAQSGNLLYYGTISEKTIEDGDTIRFESTDAISITEN